MPSRCAQYKKPGNLSELQSRRERRAFVSKSTQAAQREVKVHERRGIENASEHGDKLSMRERLAIWRKEKEKQKVAGKRTKKIPFRAGVVHHSPPKCFLTTVKASSTAKTAVKPQTSVNVMQSSKAGVKTRSMTRAQQKKNVEEEQVPVATTVAGARPHRKAASKTLPLTKKKIAAEEKPPPPRSSFAPKDFQFQAPQGCVSYQFGDSNLPSTSGLSQALKSFHLNSPKIRSPRTMSTPKGKMKTNSDMGEELSAIGTPPTSNFFPTSESENDERNLPSDAASTDTKHLGQSLDKSKPDPVTSEKVSRRRSSRVMSKGLSTLREPATFSDVLRNEKSTLVSSQGHSEQELSIDHATMHKSMPDPVTSEKVSRRRSSRVMSKCLSTLQEPATLSEVLRNEKSTLASKQELSIDLATKVSIRNSYIPEESTTDSEFESKPVHRRKSKRKSVKKSNANMKESNIKEPAAQNVVDDAVLDSNGDLKDNKKRMSIQKHSDTNTKTFPSKTSKRKINVDSTSDSDEYSMALNSFEPQRKTRRSKECKSPTVPSESTPKTESCSSVYFTPDSDSYGGISEIFKTPGPAPSSAPSAREQRRHIAHIDKSPYVEITRRRVSKKKSEVFHLLDDVPNDVNASPVLRKGNDALSSNTSAELSVTYFRNLLQKEIDNLTAKCDEWEKVKHSEEVPDVGIGHINSAIGKAKLLMSERFQQFRGLMHNCEFDLGEKTTTCTDLQGFWEMVYIQVEDVQKMFSELTALKNNDWIQKEEEKVILQKKKNVKGNKKPPTKKCGPSKALRAHILAARKNMAQKTSDKSMALETNDPNMAQKTSDQLSEKEKIFEGGFFKIKSPTNRPSLSKSITPRGESLRRSLLIHSATKKSITADLSPLPKITAMARHSVNDAVKLSGEAELAPKILLFNEEEMEVDVNTDVSGSSDSQAVQPLPLDPIVPVSPVYRTYGKQIGSPFSQQQNYNDAFEAVQQLVLKESSLSAHSASSSVPHKSPGEDYELPSYLLPTTPEESDISPLIDVSNMLEKSSPKKTRRSVRFSSKMKVGEEKMKHPVTPHVSKGKMTRSINLLDDMVTVDSTTEVVPPSGDLILFDSPITHTQPRRSRRISTLPKN